MRNDSSQFKLSRRDFAKASALAGFAILSARPSLGQSAEAVKVGLIGCGGRGFGAVMNCITGVDNVKITALADVFEEKLKDCRSKLEGIKDPKLAGKIALTDETCFAGLDAYEQLLKTDVQVIIHATPPYARPVHIEAAVKAGKHIFTEKPIAVDPVGVRQFMAAAREAEAKGLCLVAGTQRRHQKSYRDTIARIKDGAIGEILAGRAYWNGTLPFSHERKPGESDLAYRLRNWYNQCWTCGDNIVEQHIHNLDVINWVLGAHPVRVVASGGRAWKPAIEKYGDIWDNFTCDFEYPNGVHVLSMSRHWDNCANDVFEEVTGTKGKSRCNDMAKDDIDPYVQEHIDLHAAIRGEAPYINEGIQVAESCLTAIMGRMAAYTGQMLTWEEALNSDLSIVPAVLDFDRSYPINLPDDIPHPGMRA
ncbi:MAG: Gfo/Idh/MocA family oxidoreductase [Candidatus Hydrogenedentes bacterium]|nr:Gfo/Idh/MocA family oxidoreductase [Candidatus Hydrogenedentota bacterium]HOJ67989.1 Gfo/Idh/MocA family oxidoreductase [Candidatus Hydrogenedentota bacterium]